MRSQISDSMRSIILDYFADSAMRPLLEASVEEKSGQSSIWGEITLNTHYMFGGNSPHINRLAACTELIILALDIIDDVQDQDNDESVWRTYPDALALNAAVALLLAVMRELRREMNVAETQAYDKLNGLIMQAFDGQHSDLLNNVSSEEEYIDIVQRKSGSLVQLACRIGYESLRSIEKRKEDLENLNEAAALAGIIAQLDNDVRDLMRYDRKNDLIQKKKTLPIFYLLSHDHPFSIIKDYYDGVQDTAGFIQHKEVCMAYIRESGCVEYTIIVQRLCAEKAERLLNAVSALDPWKSELGNLFFDFGKCDGRAK